MQQIRNFENPDCRKTRPLLDDFISEELSIETNRVILAHIEICPRCRRERDLRVRARSLLRDSWQSRSVPPGLDERLRLTTRRNWLPLRLAAGIMVPLLGLLLYGVLIGVDTDLMAVNHVLQIAQDHVNCGGETAAEDAIPFDVHEVGLDSAVASFGDFELVAIQDCAPAEGTAFTHYIFEGPRGRISIAVEQRRGHQVLPTAEGSMRRMLAGREVHSYQLANVGKAARSVAVAALETPDHFVYIMGDELDSRQTLELAKSLVPALQQAL